jgi:carbon monoxide dehydrogenase subunit G
LISNNNNRSVQVTGGGSGHIAADIHALQAGVVTSAAFAANWFTAAGLASDAVTEVVNGVWNEPTSGHTTAGTTGKALIDSGAAGNPWSTDLATGYSGTQAGNILNNVKSQTDLIQAGGTVTVSTPVTESGQLASPLIIGDDYLNANGRAFSWTVALPSGFVAATATCKFGMRYEDDQGVNSFVQSGTVIDAGSGNVTLRFDVAKAVTGLLRPGWYDWSVEIASASGTEITRVKSGKNAEWQEKQT